MIFEGNLGERAPQTIEENRSISARMRAVVTDSAARRGQESLGSESPSSSVSASDAEVTVRLAESPWDHLQAFPLLYQQYLPFGYTNANDGRLRISPWNCSSGSHTFVAERNAQVVGAVTCLEDGPGGVPAEMTHGAILRQLRGEGRRFMEMTSLAVTPSERGPFTLLNLIRIAVSYCRGILGVSDWVCTVNPRHVRFYRKVMLLDELGQASACGTVNGAPGVLLRLNLCSMEQRYQQRYQQRYGKRPGAWNLHQFFFEPAEEERRLADLRAAAEKRNRNLALLQQVLKLLAA